MGWRLMALLISAQNVQERCLSVKCSLLCSHIRNSFNIFHYSQNPFIVTNNRAHIRCSSANISKTNIDFDVCNVSMCHIDTCIKKHKSPEWKICRTNRQNRAIKFECALIESKHAECASICREYHWNKCLRFGGNNTRISLFLLETCFNWIELKEEKRGKEICPA